MAAAPDGDRDRFAQALGDPLRPGLGAQVIEVGQAVAGGADGLVVQGSGLLFSSRCLSIPWVSHEIAFFQG